MKRVNDLRGQAAVSHTAGAISLSLGDRLRARLRHGDKGQSLVEFALVMPVLLAVLLAIFSLGIFLINYQTLTQAVNQGGMALQQVQGMAAQSDPCAVVSANVIMSAGNLQTAGTNGIQLTIQIGANPAYGPKSATGFSCTGQSGYVSAGQGVAATVTGTYPCAPFTVNGITFFASGCTMKVTSQELMQ
jgi:Flp pilus assembly protein TadG